ncbi:undecaprenyldiphospho-muramoylpentapeptide beta-N-acetylglucosaminyltransferase [Zavarzinia compransoris]|uniref:UDP-N-acetylglucosamine--N-acetylmuramyl-(pentapeptide) pyrophosphoryl-undecaprenol N-acetylglucosamine transferase n=2 Tax=Zavarzinia compransoris TaxID=1264899 RepID=A0A317DW48_9PROT|nr:undecaprenyldiphospho-muramoylpentapeptide beta-N-acetylglucosaminyltransferase [Zavarzinia compransoris]
MPAQALAAELRRRGRRVAVMTDVRGERFRAGFGDVPFAVLPAATFAGRGPLAKLRAIADIVRGIFRARRLLKDWGAVSVVGFGGYPSLPPLVAAVTLRLPTCLHEQNAVLGRVNRVMAPRLTALALSFAATRGLADKDRARAVCTGNPVRPEIVAIAAKPYAEPTETGLFRLLVLGGSLGAKVMSEVVPAALALLPPALKSRLQVTQQAREDEARAVAGIYEAEGIAADLAPFFNDVPERLDWAHLVIARAGASTVAELAAAGRPSILVPLPSAADDHQTVNAAALAEAGAAFAVPQPDFTPQDLAKRLQRLAMVPARLAEAAQAARGQAKVDAAARLADLVESLKPHSMISRHSERVAA